MGPGHLMDGCVSDYLPLKSQPIRGNLPGLRSGEFLDLFIEQLFACYGSGFVRRRPSLVANNDNRKVDLRRDPGLAMPESVVALAGNNAACVSGSMSVGPILRQENPARLVERSLVRFVKGCKRTSADQDGMAVGFSGSPRKWTEMNFDQSMTLIWMAPTGP